MEGNVVKQKARLVAKGFSQVAGEDFEETYAAVVRLESLWLTVAVAVQLGLHVWQVNFVSVYLDSIPSHTIYMQVPQGLPGGEGKVYLLLKTLYGLMQGGCKWWHTLDKTYTLGYMMSRQIVAYGHRSLGESTNHQHLHGQCLWCLNNG